MAEKHFFEQINYTKNYLLKYLQSNIDGFNKGMKILEIGCAEGGSVFELRNQGYICDGIEIEETRVEIAKKYIKDTSKIIVGDITKNLNLNEKYDIIIMRDVIEHLSEKEKALSNIYDLLNNGGILFLTFPLKYSPYAGHNQTSKNWVKYFWYITLFPKLFIKIATTKQDYREITYLKDCALSFFRLKQIIKGKWNIMRTDFFLSRPIYNIRFGWKIIKCPNIPFIREFSNGCELLLKKL